MRVWITMTLLSVLLAPATVFCGEKTETIDARMLLDLELLSDESFAVHADGRRADLTRESEMLEKLEMLDQNEIEDSDENESAPRHR
jgi:hypothetical protein